MGSDRKSLACPQEIFLPKPVVKAGSSPALLEIYQAGSAEPLELAVDTEKSRDILVCNFTKLIKIRGKQQALLNKQETKASYTILVAILLSILIVAFGFLVGFELFSTVQSVQFSTFLSSDFYINLAAGVCVLIMGVIVAIKGKLVVPAISCNDVNFLEKPVQLSTTAPPVASFQP